MGTSYTLTQRIEQRQAQRESRLKVTSLYPVPMWRRRLNAKDLTGAVLVNGSWTPTDEGGAA